MKLLEYIARGIVSAEESLDWVKLRYKERFRRFDPARPLLYRGYGRQGRVFIRGRVLEDSETGFEPEPGWRDNIRNTIRRFETDEIRGARVRARFQEQELECTADNEAFFRFEFHPGRALEPGWHRVEAEIVESMAHEDTGVEVGEALIPPEDADFVVVSDMDDTVIQTGASDRTTLLRVVMTNDAHSRKPFEGVGALYHALQAGPGGNGFNPIFYLSRSPWNVYELLTGFMEHHELPKGPLLLRDAGLEEEQLARFLTESVPSASATPAESYPRYSRPESPAMITSSVSSPRPTQPMMPHISGPPRPPRRSCRRRGRPGGPGPSAR